jgi:5-methylcytosine-specific restriction enzyme A
MKRLCLECPNTIDTREGSRCKRCRAKRERQRGTRHERGLGTDHDRIRKQVLADEPYCYLCGAPATQADHVVPRIKGGRNERENYRGACGPCNARKGER